MQIQHQILQINGKHWQTDKKQQLQTYVVILEKEESMKRRKHWWKANVDQCHQSNSEHQYINSNKNNSERVLQLQSDSADVYCGLVVTPKDLCM
jgi:hypothetical protein